MIHSWFIILLLTIICKSSVVLPAVRVASSVPFPLCLNAAVFIPLSVPFPSHATSRCHSLYLLDTINEWILGQAQSLVSPSMLVYGSWRYDNVLWTLIIASICQSDRKRLTDNWLSPTICDGRAGLITSVIMTNTRKTASRVCREYIRIIRPLVTCLSCFGSRTFSWHNAVLMLFLDQPDQELISFRYRTHLVVVVVVVVVVVHVGATSSNTPGSVPPNSDRDDISQECKCATS